MKILPKYTDDGILCGGPSATEVNTIMTELPCLFNITDEGEINTYLGVKIMKPKPWTQWK